MLEGIVMVQRHAPWFKPLWYHYRDEFGKGTLVGSIASNKKTKDGHYVPNPKSTVYYVWLPHKKTTWRIPGKYVFGSVDALLESVRDKIEK